MATSRDRDEAHAAMMKWAAKASSEASPLIPTKELVQRLQNREQTILVDCREVEEQQTSMIPGAVTRDEFEDTILPGLRAESNALTMESSSQSPLVVPYCTVGFRSGLFCKELTSKHGLTNVRNGEGIILWTFDGGRLVRPLQSKIDAPPRRAPPLLPEVPPDAVKTGLGALASEDVSGDRRSGEPSSDMYGNRLEELRSEPEVVLEVHVYGEAWNFAGEGFTTVYFSKSKGGCKTLLWMLRQESVQLGILYTWVLLLFYLTFTPACGVMYKCGCRMALSKWGQVETCNVYEHASDKCPWCNCSGLSCIFVAADAAAFRGIFFFDLLPNGCFVTVITVAVLHTTWKRIGRMSQRYENSFRILALKAVVALLWFVMYCLLVGFLFFMFTPDYPYFLGIQRRPWTSDYAVTAPSASHSNSASQFSPARARFLISPHELHDNDASWVRLDARSPAEAGSSTIPGSIVVPWQALALGSDVRYGQTAVLRPATEIAHMLAAAGANGSRPVAVFGSWDQGWGEEGRLFWTLEYLGFAATGIACLDGGIQAWVSAGYSLGVPDLIISQTHAGGMRMATAQPAKRATAELITGLLDEHPERVLLLDVRDLQEFEGSSDGDRNGAARSGHIPNAVWWPWRESLFVNTPSSVQDGSPPKLKACADILASLPATLTTAHEVVTYCTGGIRSGFVYMVLRGCGIGNRGGPPHLRNYDGSWWQWASLASLPCEGNGAECQPLTPVPAEQPPASVSTPSPASFRSGGSGRLL